MWLDLEAKLLTQALEAGKRGDEGIIVWHARLSLREAADVLRTYRRAARWRRHAESERKQVFWQHLQHNSEKCPKTGPRRTQDRPRQAHKKPRRAKSRQDRSKTSPRQAQDRPRQSQDRARQAQNTPKTGPRQAKTGQDRTKTGSRQAKTGRYKPKAGPKS